jgi:hypothetical protein
VWKEGKEGAECRERKVRKVNNMKKGMEMKLMNVSKEWKGR